MTTRITYRPIKQCIFCDNKADSKEHAWADWVLKRLRPRHNALMGVIGKEEIIDPYRKAIRVRCVCQSCNGGWMKGLEDAAIPVAGAMMHDLAIPLDQRQQQMIAAWALKTAMVWEHLSQHKRPIFHTQEERSHLRTRLMIPPYTGVWLARSSGELALFTQGTDVWGNLFQDMPRLQGYVTTFAYRYLAIQILALRVLPGAQRQAIVYPNPGPWERCTIQIWPPTADHRWPPLLSLGDRVPLETFVRRWSVGPEAPEAVAGY